MTKWNSGQGWAQLTHTMARNMPRDLYRSKRARQGLVKMTKLVRK